MNPNLTTLFKKLFSIAILAYIALIGIGITVSDQLIFLPPPPTYIASDNHLLIPSKNSTNTHSKNKIVAQYLENPLAEYTIIYSHGNAVDIGGLQHLIQNFYQHGYSIIVYDYSGYGHSEGIASEQQVYHDAQAVYDYLITNKKLQAEQIISYGHSLGAAIATDLAYNKPVAALILESPFTTAFRVKTTYSIVPFDKFTSIDKIKSIHAPVFITHSRDDPVIPFWHGKELFASANTPKKFLAFEREGHSNITHSAQFWPELDKFVSSIN